jgi:hypothetical protein
MIGNMGKLSQESVIHKKWARVSQFTPRETPSEKGHSFPSPAIPIREIGQTQGNGAQRREISASRQACGYAFEG